jgi:hypothetical protein
MDTSLSPGLRGASIWVLGLRRTGAEALRLLAVDRYPDARFLPVRLSEQLESEPVPPPFLLLKSGDLSLTLVQASGIAMPLADVLRDHRPDAVVLLARHTANPETTIDAIAGALAGTGTLVICFLAGSFMPAQVIRSLRHRRNPCPRAGTTLFCLPNDSDKDVVSDMSARQQVNVDAALLAAATKGVLDILYTPGLINLDFADVVHLFGHGGVGLCLMTDTVAGQEQELAPRLLAQRLWRDVSLDQYGALCAIIQGGAGLSLQSVNDVASDLLTRASDDAALVYGVSMCEGCEQTRLILLSAGLSVPDVVHAADRADAGPHGTSAPVGSVDRGAVFISYARTDFDRIRPTLELLQGSGFTLWYDQEGILPSDDCFDRIARAVADCVVVVAFLSERASVSQFVRKEISFALTKNKAVLPVYLEQFEMPAGLELQIGTHQRLDRYRLDADQFHRLLTASLLRYMAQDTKSGPSV